MMDNYLSTGLRYRAVSEKKMSYGGQETDVGMAANCSAKT